MTDNIRFLLLQIRNSGDPMRSQEVDCFARALQTDRQQIDVFDLLSPADGRRQFEQADVFLLGGSGEYSATDNGTWLDRALDRLRDVHASRKPTFASCWGFQAMARAMGGTVEKDIERAEVGTHELQLTDAGREDPVFAKLGHDFLGQMGHEDCVTKLPPGTTLLASSSRVTNQAYRFNDRPIYCTQFHPELNCANLMERIQAYPEYIERVAGISLEEFRDSLQETPAAEALLRRFVSWALDQ